MPKPSGDEESFDALCGVPVQYARLPVAPYGSRGERRTFRCTRTFRDRLEACIGELIDICPLGRPQVITSAGAYVNKPGYHGLGRAFDVDAIFWEARAFITRGFPSDRAFYLGVESVVRRHFGLVLDYLYNADHHDHLHLTDQVPVGFEASSRSRVLYLQAALTWVHDRPVIIDGVWGSETTRAIAEVLESLAISGRITTKGTWLKFLSATARKAFAGSIPPADRSPKALFADLLAEIELGSLPPDARRRLEAAARAFDGHPETRRWLDGFNP